MLALECLESRQLARRPDRRRFRSTAVQAPLARVLLPLREHERVDRERGRDRLHLNPRLLTQADGRQLELVTIAPHRAWA